jgi:hypothetical protein
LLDTLPGNSTEYVDGPITDPGDYRYEVSALKGAKESTPRICHASKPAPPGGLVCRAANLGLEDGDVVLTWTNGEVYESISLFRDGGMVAVLPGDATVFLDPDIPLGTHTYRLLGILPSGQSDLSEECQVEVPIGPPGPVDLGCSIGSGTASLRWTPGAVYDSVEISRRGPGDLDPIPIATLPGDQAAYEDQDLSRTGEYLYCVVGVMQERRSPRQCCFATLPVAPVVDPAACADQEPGIEGTDVLITWENGGLYDSIAVVRIRIEPQPGEMTAVSLLGDQTAFMDRDVPNGEYQYAILGIIDGSSAESAVCPVEVRRIQFIRGEVNNDGLNNLADVVYLFNYIFLGGPRPSCFDAADANDDGDLDLSDPIWIISYQYYSGPIYPPPFPHCGFDPTRDVLDCEDFPLCP